MPIYEFEGIRPVVDPTAFVHPTATLIGDVIIGPGCLVGPGASLRGDIGRLVMGPGSNVQDNCTVHVFPGKDCTIEAGGHVGHGAVLHGCTVGRNALVGMNAVVMDDAIIGVESFVAAMSFVRAGTAVPDRTLVAGIPAKTIRLLRDEEIAWKTEGTTVYQRLAQRYRATCRPAEPLPAVEPDRARVPDHAYAPKHEAGGDRPG
ncbi:MAG: transferase hexapeptide repeat family protein [Phycisphaerales bacterium]|nr:transferase hexapeptide repeat family protein [Phycisphaerales bacterium]NNM24637.1 transferase hexapeptide repeat family protein [Phycisphaerales bacterium]